MSIQSIEKLVTLEIAWVKDAGSPHWLAHCDGEKCSLQMNDFPAEPLYTLTWKGESYDFDNTPEKWVIPRD
jgi:hypothetical protein